MSLKEDIGGAVSAGGPPTNNISSGNIAGAGVGPQGEPGGKKALLRKRIQKRKDPVLENVVVLKSFKHFVNLPTDK